MSKQGDVSPDLTSDRQHVPGWSIRDLSTHRSCYCRARIRGNVLFRGRQYVCCIHHRDNAVESTILPDLKCSLHPNRLHHWRVREGMRRGLVLSASIDRHWWLSYYYRYVAFLCISPVRLRIPVKRMRMPGLTSEPRLPDNGQGVSDKPSFLGGYRQRKKLYTEVLHRSFSYKADLHSRCVKSNLPHWYGD